HLVAIRERPIALGVLLVHRVQQPLRFVAETERRPDIGDPIDPVELALAPAGTFAQAREKLDVDAHDQQPSSGCARPLRAALLPERLVGLAIPTFRSAAGDCRNAHWARLADGLRLRFLRRLSSTIGWRHARSPSRHAFASHTARCSWTRFARATSTASPPRGPHCRDCSKVPWATRRGGAALGAALDSR